MYLNRAGDAEENRVHNLEACPPQTRVSLHILWLARQRDQIVATSADTRWSAEAKTTLEYEHVVMKI